MMSWTLAVMCELYRRHYLEIYDRRFWVKELNPKVQEIRRTLLDLKTITRKQTSFINTVGDFLAIRIQSRFNNHYHKECELGRVQIAELTRQAFSDDLPTA